jgi:hypothetical protein
MQLMLNLSFWSSCLSSPSAERTTRMHHHA